MEKKEHNNPNKVSTGKHTVNLDNEEIERMPDSDEDYRLPRSLPDEAEPYKEFPDEDVRTDEDDELLDDSTNISPEEIALLEEAEYDTSSDESRASDILEDTDDDGDPLNEGPDEDNLFDTGSDLDMPDNILDPDPDYDDDKRE